MNESESTERDVTEEPINVLEQERYRINVLLAEREHRLIPALEAFLRNRRSDEELRIATTKSLFYCVIRRFFTTGLIASIAGVGVFGSYLAWQANNLLWEQNSRISVQSHLIEAERRAALVFELSALMQEVADEKLTNTISESNDVNLYKQITDELLKREVANSEIIKEKLNTKIYLSNALTARIAALSLSLRPYYYVDYSSQSNREDTDDESSDSGWFISLTNSLRSALLPDDENNPNPALVEFPLSPERGQLLLYLLASNVDLLSIANAGGNFSSSELENRIIKNSYFPPMDLSNTDFSGTSFEMIRFGTPTASGQVILDGADFTCATFVDTWLSKSSLKDAKFSYVKFSEFDILLPENSQIEQNSANSVYASALWEADLTNADFHQAHIPIESAPWIMDTQKKAPQGFDRDKWEIQDVGRDINGNRIYSLYAKDLAELGAVGQNCR